MAEDSGMTGWHTWAEVAAVCVAFGIAATAITLCIKILKFRRRNAELNPDIVPRPDGENRKYQCSSSAILVTLS